LEMNGQIRMDEQTELQALRQLACRVGNDPLFTQASTGNISIKLDGVLWIKASGKWMGGGMRGDFLVPLDLAAVERCLQQGVDPTERFPDASLETAMHAVVPRRVVLHVHCVNTIAWAVRRDAPIHLTRLLDGLQWQWVPYRASGLPLSREIQLALRSGSDTTVFVLGNHGLVVAGDDSAEVEDLVKEVRNRLDIQPRIAHPADYAALLDIAADSSWKLPDDDEVHAMATDPISRSILVQGLLYPCQAVFSKSATSELFFPVPYLDIDSSLHDRPFLMVKGCGVVVNESLGFAELAMISGLAQVVQRLNEAAPLRYLTNSETVSLLSDVAHRYRELASQ
jgi:rhamnose utilization protein RhaD (predicted bifunctional aldolase and dehydrogenase)